jgi:hypothetical protein
LVARYFCTDESSAELLREVISVDHARETPSDVFLFVAALTATAPAFDTAQAVEIMDCVERATKPTFRHRKLDDVRRVALIHARGDLALAAGYWRLPKVHVQMGLLTPDHCG